MRGASKPSPNKNSDDLKKQAQFDLGTAYTALIQGWKRQLESNRSNLFLIDYRQEVNDEK